MFYMVSTKLSHPDPIHYNNRLAKFTKVKKNLMKFKSSKEILAQKFSWRFNVEMEK